MVGAMAAGGYFVDLTRAPPAIAWVRYTSSWYYALGLLYRAICPDLDGAHLDALTAPYSVSPLGVAADVFAMLLYTALCRLIMYAALKTTSKLKFS